MISFKESEIVQPIYYYVETDLDNLDDQPVDYSKKYTDQDAYEIRKKTKSKTVVQFSASAEPVLSSQNAKQSCSDEVKVYCIEGTPLTISSASSFSDLRDIGPITIGISENSSLDEQQRSLHFDCIKDVSNSREPYEIEKTQELSDCSKIALGFPKEKDDIKEGKSVLFRNEEDISKASSPLMFSRSSSVCSLNSFEQHSIDDRSSVSVFSALTSGIISPSDLPDSPGELERPSSADKSTSLKNTSKDDSDDESDKVLNFSKDEVKDQNIENDILEPVCHSLPRLQHHKSKENVHKQETFNESNDNYDSEGDDVLVRQSSSQLEASNVEHLSTEVFENKEYPAVPSTVANKKLFEQEANPAKCEDFIVEENDDILLQQCIQLGMPSNLSRSNMPKMFPAELYHPCNGSLDNAKGDLKKTEKLEEELEADENDILLQQCIQLGMPKSSQEPVAKKKSISNTEYLKPSSNKINPYRDNCPDGISDDDDDEDEDDMLAKCIRAGMPSPKTVIDLQEQPQYSSNGAVKKIQNSRHVLSSETCRETEKKVFNPRLPQNPIYAPIHSGTCWITNSSFIEVDSMRIYHTEDTPILSPTASLSDLSSLSFSDDKNCHESHLNNSRNSDCSSESEDDELLIQCIRSGMPGAKSAA